MSAKPDRRAEILQAAFEAFAEHGYDRTTMDDIVRRSGLSKGTLYWHFKNKRDLFLAVVNMAMDQMASGFGSLLQEDRPVADRIREAFDQAAVFFVENKNWIGLLVDAFFQSYKNAEAQEIMREAYEHFIQMITVVIEQGIERGEFRPVDPRQIAVVLMGGGDGITFYTLFEPNWDAQTALNTFVNLILRGLERDI
jgi:AcrR family transcriptional regulator